MMMKSVSVPVASLALLLLLVLWAPSASDGQKFGPGRQEKAPARKSDLKYIRCGVCKNLIREASRLVSKIKDDADQPGKQIKEITIMEAAEKLCDPESDNGAWIGKTDLVQSGQELKLVDMNKYGDCQVECRTIAKACEDLMDEFEMDLAEKLFKGSQQTELTSLFCHDVTDACSSPIPKLSKKRLHDEEFKEIDEKEFEMKKMMKQMKDMGMGGQVYDRQTMMDRVDDLEEQLGRAAPQQVEQPEEEEGSWISDGLDMVKSTYESVTKSAKDMWKRVQQQYGSKKPEL